MWVLRKLEASPESAVMKPSLANESSSTWAWAERPEPLVTDTSIPPLGLAALDRSRNRLKMGCAASVSSSSTSAPPITEPVVGGVKTSRSSGLKLWNSVARSSRSCVVSWLSRVTSFWAVPMSSLSTNGLRAPLEMARLRASLMNCCWRAMRPMSLVGSCSQWPFW